MSFKIDVMKRCALSLAGALLLAPLTFAKPADSPKEENERLQDAGTVMHEILPQVCAGEEGCTETATL